jgi:hypothetical protein
VLLMKFDHMQREGDIRPVPSSSAAIHLLPLSCFFTLTASKIKDKASTNKNNQRMVCLPAQASRTRGQGSKDLGLPGSAKRKESPSADWSEARNAAGLTFA